MTAPKIAIVGGGLAGLTAAYTLRKEFGSQATIVILEAYDRLGGKLKTVEFETGPVDMGAEAYLAKHNDFTDLVEEIGLGDYLNTPSGLPSGFYNASGSGDLLVEIPKDTIMGIPACGAAVRHVLGQAAADRIDAEGKNSAITWSVGDDVVVGTFVAERLGRDVVDQLVSPLLGGVYSCTADDLGLRATIPQLAEELDSMAAQGADIYLVDAVSALLERRYVAAQKSTTSGPPFRAVTGGYAAIVDGLVEHTNPEIVYNTAVESIFRMEGGWYIEPIGEFDAVVVATPAPTASVLVKDVAPKAAQLLESVELASSAVVGMRFETQDWLPQRSGVLLGEHAPTEAKAFTFCSRKWPHLDAAGGSIVRASFGNLHKPWYLELEDRTLLSYALDDLEKVTGHREEPVEFFVQRWWGGLPSYSVGHLGRMEEVVRDISTIPGLAIAGATLNGVGVPATAGSGTEAALKLTRDLQG